MWATNEFEKLCGIVDDLNDKFTNYDAFGAPYTLAYADYNFYIKLFGQIVWDSENHADVDVLSFVKAETSEMLNPFFNDKIDYVQQHLTKEFAQADIDVQVIDLAYDCLEECKL